MLLLLSYTGRSTHAVQKLHEFQGKNIQENYTETESDSEEPASKCRSRECENCGIDHFEVLPEESDMSEIVYHVNWTWYEYTKIRVMSKDIKKVMPCQKSTSPGEMFNYFKEILVTFPARQFRANWQSNQRKQLLENLPRQDKIVFMCTTFLKTSNQLFSKKTKLAYTCP